MALFIAANNLSFVANPPKPPPNIKILYLGSSYFNYNSLPLLVENLVNTSGKTMVRDQYIPNGIYLADHATSDVTAAKIQQQKWDYVVLQGVGSLTAYPENITHHPVLPSLHTLCDLIKANHEETKIIFCLPWAFEDGMTWNGWPDTYSDMQNAIYSNTLQYAEEVGCQIAPVGWAWKAVLQEKEFPLHYLHLSDWNHPNLKGSYLMACVIYSTIFLEPTTENSY